MKRSQKRKTAWRTTPEVTAAAEAFIAARQAPGEPRPATPEAIRRVLSQVWCPRFHERHPDEIERAATEIHDVLAAAAGVDMKRTFLEMGSLPEVWAACWRPMAGGATGLSEARSVRALQAPAAQAAIERLARARATVAEIVHLDVASRRTWMRDLFDGTTYVLQVRDHVAAHGTRHLRMFGVLVALGDGTWDFPSVLLVSDGFQAMSPEAILGAARDAVSESGADPDEIDPAAPHAGLARWAGVVGAKLLSLKAPVRRKRVVTSEGHAPETNIADLVLPPEAERALWAARADDIVAGGEVLTFVDRAMTRMHPDGETIGIVARAGDKLRIETISRERFERLLDRIQKITGARPQVESLRRNPAPVLDGGSPPGPDEDVLDVVIGAPVPVAAGQPSSVGRAAQMRHLRATLDAHVPMIAGVPRALVATEEGRAAVERWLRDAERSGYAGGEGPRFLDLDPLRAELGLPTIASSLGL